jgi:hypothetical protein
MRVSNAVKFTSVSNESENIVYVWIEFWPLYR